MTRAGWPVTGSANYSSQRFRPDHVGNDVPQAPPCTSRFGRYQHGSQRIQPSPHQSIQSLSIYGRSVCVHNRSNAPSGALLQALSRPTGASRHCVEAAPRAGTISFGPTSLPALASCLPSLTARKSPRAPPSPVDRIQFRVAHATERLRPNTVGRARHGSCRLGGAASDTERSHIPAVVGMGPLACSSAVLLCLNQSAPGGIRTPNLLIRSQMLYPLSYGRGRLESRPRNYTSARRAPCPPAGPADSRRRALACRRIAS